LNDYVNFYTDLDGYARIRDGGSGLEIVDMGAYEYFYDCDVDEPALMDWNSGDDHMFDTNGVVDLYDFAAFQRCYADPFPSERCLAAFDRALECGVIDLNDWEVMAAQMDDGLGEGMAPLGGGEFGDMMSMPMDGFSELVEEPAEWTYDDASLAIEIRPAGGGEPVTVLRPHTTYALHYVAGHSSVNAYTAFVTAPTAGKRLRGATAATTGDWALAGHFGFLDGTAGDAEDLLSDGPQTQIIMDDFDVSGEVHAGPTGHVCDFTTRGAGTLSLDVIATWTDMDAHLTVLMQARRDLVVEP
jgi:hypothetical protein